MLAEQADRVRQIWPGSTAWSARASSSRRAAHASRSRSTSPRRRRLGVKPGDVRRAEATLLQGIQVGSVFEDQKVFDVDRQGVPGHAAERRRRPRICSSTGPAAATSGSGRSPTCGSWRRRSSIERDAVSRRVDVEAGVERPQRRRGGRRHRATALASMSFPLEYHAEVLERRARPRRSARPGARLRRRSPSSPPSCCSRRPSGAGGWRRWCCRARSRWPWSAACSPPGHRRRALAGLAARSAGGVRHRRAHIVLLGPPLPGPGQDAGRRSGPRGGSGWRRS